MLLLVPVVHSWFVPACAFRNAEMIARWSTAAQASPVVHCDRNRGRAQVASTIADNGGEAPARLLPLESVPSRGPRSAVYALNT